MYFCQLPTVGLTEGSAQVFTGASPEGFYDHDNKDFGDKI